MGSDSPRWRCVVAWQRLLAELALMDAAQAKIASPNRPKRPQILGRVREEQAEAEVAGGPRLSVSCMLLVWVALGWMSFLWTVRNPSLLYPLLPPLVMAGCEPAPRVVARAAWLQQPVLVSDQLNSPRMKAAETEHGTEPRKDPRRRRSMNAGESYRGTEPYHSQHSTSGAWHAPTCRFRRFMAYILAAEEIPAATVCAMRSMSASVRWSASVYASSRLRTQTTPA